MSTTKNILFTDPRHPLQLRLAAQYLTRTPHVVRFLVEQRGGTAGDASEREFVTRWLNAQGIDPHDTDARVRFVERAPDEEPAAPSSADRARCDEVWCTATATEAWRDDGRASCRLLSLLAAEPAAVFNYIGAACAGDEELAALVESGRDYRAFHPPLLAGAGADEPADGFARFFFQLLRFVAEVKDKSREYWRDNALRLRLDARARLGFIDAARAAEIIFQHATAPATLRRDFRLAPSQSVRVGSFFAAVAARLGVRFEFVREAGELNRIDRLFDLQAPALDLRGGEFDGGAEARADEAAREAEAADLLARTLLDDYARGEEERARRSEEALRALEKGELELEDGARLSYYVGGRGARTLVLVNAYGQGFGYWSKLVADLMRRHRVVVWVPRGSAHETNGVAEAHGVGTHADDLARVLTHLGVERGELLGWCTGPKLLLEFYARYPERVSTMTFLTGTFKNLSGRRDLETEYESSLDPLLRMVVEMPHVAGLLSDSLKAVLLKREGVKGDGAGGWTDAQAREVLTSVNESLQAFVVEPFSNERSVVGYARQLVDFWNHDIEPLLPRVAAPVLVIGGECDKIASPQMSRVAAGLIPRARYVEVSGGSHYLHYEKHELIGEMLDRFITQTWDFDFNHGLLSKN